MRKYGVGVASVLIGLTFMGGYTVTAHADTQTAPVVAVQDSQKQSEEDTNSAANQSVADSAVSSQATASQATSDSAVKSTTATNATPAESNEVASSAKQTAQVAAIKADSSAQAQSASAASLLTNLAAQPASDSAQYNVNDWNYTTNTDGSGITITGYKGTTPDDGAYYIPNSADFRSAGKISADQQASINMIALKNLWSNGATKISIHIAATRKDMLIATGGGKTKYGANDWANTLGDSSINNTLKEVDLSGLDVSTVTSLSNFFYNDTALEKVTGIANWDISNVRGLGHMFANTPALTYIDPLTNWDTTNVEKTDHLFDGATSLTSVGDLSNWNLKNVDNAVYMFANTSKLDNIGNISGWFPQGSKITTIKSMFDEASSLTSVGDISNWDTSNINDMGQLFRGDLKLVTIGDLSNWNVSNVTRMAGMFQGIAASTIGDLSNWDTNKVTNMDYMFAFTPNLTNVGNLSATATGDRPGWNNSGTLQVAYRMFFHAGIKNVDVSGWKFSENLSKTPSGVDNSGTSYIGPMTTAKRNNDMFAYLENPATITVNDWPSNVTANLHAADFDGYQPLIVISNDSNLQKLNSDEITSEQVNVIDHQHDHVGTKGHVANTVTFVTESEPAKAVASQQQDFVFANEDALNTALAKIPATDNWKDLTVNSSSTKLGDVAQADSGKYLNGQHNATQTPAYEGNYGKIAGTYSVVADTQDVTQEMINDKSYPAEHMKQATYQVVEKFPASYKGEGTLTAAEYAKEIGDSDVAKYEGYVYKIIANQTVTAYQTATKNLATGEITYSTNYNSKYLKYATTTKTNVVDPTKPLWSHSISEKDQTLIENASVDTPAGYTISAPSDVTIGKYVDAGQERPMLKIGYDKKDHTFSYDFMYNASDINAKYNVKFNSLPASYNFYIDYTAQTQDVTQEMINDKSYPADHMKEATYQVVEKFPASYKGEGTLTAAEYAKEIDDSDVAKYEGYVYKIIANQTVTAYQTATKNLATGEITYSNDYNCKYVTFKTTTDKTVNGKKLWDYPKDPNDITYIGDAPVDTPAGYDISAPKNPYETSEKDANGNAMLTISYNSKDHTFNYDFMVGTSDGNANKQVMFSTLPASYNFYIDYTAARHSVTITYKDQDGNTIKTDTVNGNTDETVNTNSTVPAGWKLTEGEKVPSQIDFTYGKDGKPNFKNITVTIEHATTTVQPDDPKTPSDKLPDNPDKNYPSGVSKDDLNKTITRTIKITKPDGTVVDKTQTLSFERTATVDEVTGEVVAYGDWKPVKDGSASFGEVDVPEIPGYTPTQSNVPAQSLTNDEITNWQDTSVNVTYTADPQSTEIIYQTIDGKQVGTTTLNGVTDQTIKVSPEAPEGYWIDKSDQEIPATYTFKASDNHPITVIVVKKEDGTLPPTTDDKDVALIIQYQDKDGKVVGTQIVTGKVGANEQIKLDIPDGYYSSQSTLDHTFKANDSVEIISVTKKEEQTGTPTTDDKKMAVIVEFKDQDGKVVGTQVIEGDEGTTDTFDLNIPDGYYSSNDQLTHTFKSGDSTVTVNVTKKDEAKGDPTTDDKKMAVIVEFKDQDGKVIGTQVIEGKEGTTDTFDLNIPDGYYSSNDELTHTFKPGDSTVTVNVTKKEEGTLPPTTDDKDVAVLIEYTDPSGKVIKTDIISGKPGSTIQVPSDLPAGYQTTGDVPTTYTIGKGDHQVVVINVTPINADSGSTQPDQPSSGSDTPSSSANPGSDIPAQSGASDSDSAQPDQPSSGSEMPSSSADSASDSNSATVTPSEPTSTATASSAVASDAPAASASAAITGQAVVTSATPTTAAPAQSQATQRNLPQTGNDSRKATSIAGLALASLAGILGFGAKRKKEN